MSRFAINPNALPSEQAEERAALERDNAHLHHFDDDGAGVDYQVPTGGPPLPPAMFVPDPRYPHGDIDEIEEGIAALKRLAAEGRREPPKAPPAPVKPEAEKPAVRPMKAQDHPLVASLVAALPAPGEAWPEADRAAWLKAAEGIFALVYTTEKNGQKAA